MSEWTVDTLREHIDQRFADQDKAVQAALAAAKEAVATALAATKEAVAVEHAASEKRFANVNEFRAQQTEILSMTMPRAETEQRLSAMVEKLDDLKERFNVEVAKVQRTEGRTEGTQATTQGISAKWVLIAAVASPLVSIAGLVIAYAALK
jgi:uncharacterized protein YecA (UPF0149 family)